MLRRLFWLALAGLAIFAWQAWPPMVTTELEQAVAGIDAPPGFDSRISIDRPPVQENLARTPTPLVAGDFRITPVASFELEARVLGRRGYRLGTESRLSPIDLALGWGPMARPEVLEDIRIRQSGRFYRWQVNEFPIPRQEIETHSANMHLIPASREIARALNRVREGANVRLGGYLVNVDRDDGWHWRTSMTRDDTGAGACEIVLVTRIERL